jgi:hypothetical protein
VGETLVAYRVADLPEPLTRVLPPDAGPRRCLFWIARTGSAATGALFQAITEPETDHVEEGMRLAGDVARVAARSRMLAELIRPEDTAGGPQYGGTYRFGFHAGDADEVQAWFIAAGHRLVPIRAVIDPLLVLIVRGTHPEPPHGLGVRRVRRGRLVIDYLACAEPGLFALELEPGEPAIGLSDGSSMAELDARAGVFEVELVPTMPRPLRAPRAQTEAAMKLVREAYADAWSILDASGEEVRLELELRLDDDLAHGTLRACDASGELRSVSDQPVELVPEDGALDLERYAALCAGLRRARGQVHEHAMPCDLVPIHLLRYEELQTADDFARAAFDLRWLAEHAGRLELPRLLEGLPIEGDPARLWRLFPSAALDHGAYDVADGTAALATEPHAEEIGARIVRAWVARVFEEREHAMSWQPMYTETMEALEATIGEAAFLDAMRRALEVHYAAPR